MRWVWPESSQVLKDAPRYPLTYYLGVPSSAPPFPHFEGGEKFSLADLRRLLKRPEALGLSEVTAFVRILQKDPRMLKLLISARRLGKTAEGHTIGVNQEKLNALIGAGLTSCHESLTAGDVLKRLRLGLVCHAARRLHPQRSAGIVPGRPADCPLMTPPGSC